MKKALIALLAALLLLSACGGERSAETVTVWRSVAPYYRTDGELLRSETFPASTGVSLVNSAISRFNSDSADKELTVPLPTGMRILGYETVGGELRLELPAAFGQLSAAKAALARCAMALTFCSIDGVERVSVWCQGEELYPPLSAGDVMLTDDAA